MKRKTVERRNVKGLAKGRNQVDPKFLVCELQERCGFGETLINVMLDMLNLKYVAHPDGNRCSAGKMIYQFGA